MKTSSLLLILPLFILFGCTTYYIPMQSFKEQFAGIDSTKLREVTTEGPAWNSYTYLANPIDTIHCVDGDNKPFILLNSPSIEIRFTENDDSRTIFYFDQVYVQDSLIVGVKSRFIPSFKGEIPINNVKLIEVQDGKKNFHYIKKNN